MKLWINYGQTFKIYWINLKTFNQKIFYLYYFYYYYYFGKILKILLSSYRTLLLLDQSGKAVPLSRLFLISKVYFPKARSIFLLKCSLRSLIESMSFSSWNFLLRLNDWCFSSLSLSSFTILSILSSDNFGACTIEKCQCRLSIF